MNQPKVTILVPNYRTPEITRICLRLLRKNTDPSLARVIVIDNDSADESLEYLRTLRWIDLIERTNVPEEGPAKSHSSALDLALKHVDTPYVLSIHTDTFIKRPDWLEMLLEPFGMDTRVSGVGSWKLESKPAWKSAGKYIEKGWKDLLGWVIGKQTYDPVRFDATQHYLRSHCALYRTDIIRQLDTSFGDGGRVAGRIMHYKMVEAGYRMVFLPSERLGVYLDHLNHATMVLNPELGSSASSVREGRRRIKKKMRGIDALEILSDESLDR